MSKIGKKSIILPEGVELHINWADVSVKWPKGELKYTLNEWVSITQEANEVKVAVDSTEKRNLWWLARTLINNMVVWVSQWYTKKLLLQWVWYSVKLEWTHLNFALWLSHRVNFEIPSDMTSTVEQDAKWNYAITVSWIDKQRVWEVSAQIRGLKKPEPYKWKWIRYSDEYIKLKPGKAAKK